MNRGISQPKAMSGQGDDVVAREVGTYYARQLTCPTPAAMANTACHKRALGQGYYDGFKAGVLAERLRVSVPQWVPVSKSTWFAVYGGRYFRAWQRPKDSGPDGGLFIVTETGVAGVPLRQLVEDAPSWKAVNDTIVESIK